MTCQNIKIAQLKFREVSLKTKDKIWYFLVLPLGVIPGLYMAVTTSKKAPEKDPPPKVEHLSNEDVKKAKRKIRQSSNHDQLRDRYSRPQANPKTFGPK